MLPQISGLATAAVLLFAFSVATAESPSPQEIEQFERHVASGAEAMDSEDYQTAVEELTAAADIVDHPRIHLQIGKAYAAMYECEKARDVFTAVRSRDDLNDELRTRVGRQIAEIHNCSKNAELLLECTPDDLTITAGGHSVECSAPLELEPGEYRMRASRDGYESATVYIDLDPGDEIERTIELDPRGEDRDPLLYSGIASLVLGGIGLGSGMYQETTTGPRARQLIEARNEDDRQRIDALRSDAELSRTIAITSYGIGVAAVATGLGLLWYRSAAGDDIGDTPTVEINFAPRGAHLLLRWK